MSRLDSAIRRLTAQRACLDHAANLIRHIPGPVLELGLGNGRTFDHLRERLPDREVFVFDRQIAAHPACIPDDDHLFLGDFRDTLPSARDRLPALAALAHVDVGTGDETASRALGEWLAVPLASLLGPGAVVLSDQPLPIPGAKPLPLPDSVAVGRVHFLQIPQLSDQNLTGR